MNSVFGKLLLLTGLFLALTSAQAADAVKQIVFPLAKITAHPTNQTVSTGQRVEFNAAVVGTLITGYQWHKNGKPVPGATNLRYVIPSARKGDAGKYRFEVRNAGGSRFSSNATLTVSCRYSISSNSTFITFEGGTRVFSVTASGDCAWRASTTNTWITITGGATNSRSGQVTFTVQTNNSNVARSGFIKAGGKTFLVAQGAEFAPAALRGRTLAMTIESGTGTAETNGTFVFRAFGAGTNFWFWTTPGTTNFSLTNYYSFNKTTPKTATLSFDNVTYNLSFQSASTGQFTGTNDTAGTQSGTFKLATAIGDYNIDALPDLFTQSTNSLTNVITFIAVSNIQSGVDIPVLTLRTNILQAIGAADCNGDDLLDIWLRSPAGDLSVFPITGGGGTSVALLLRAGKSANPWKPVSVVDLNSDDKPDILFQHPDRRLAVWLLNGTNFIRATVLRGGAPAAAGWRAVGTGDMNGDRQVDILFQGENGNLAAWLMHGQDFVRSEALHEIPAIPDGSRIVALADYNSDGHTDILWQNASNHVVGWFMNDLTFVREETFFIGDALPAGKRLFAPK